MKCGIQSPYFVFKGNDLAFCGSGVDSQSRFILLRVSEVKGM